MPSPKQPDDRKEKLRLARRKKIVDAARESFLRKGYAATSMSALIGTIGGSKETLWAYFRSKEELFAATLEPAISSMWVDTKQTICTRGPVEAVVLDFCGRFMEMTDQPESLDLWRLLASESGRFPEVGRSFREHVVSVTERVLADYFEVAVERGSLRQEDCVSMARVLISLCINRLDRKLWSDPEAGSEASIEVEAAWLTTIFLRAFAT